ncbi:MULTISPECIES: RNA methyltransferase [unclassified Mycolicibacterium]|uniref:TrmH family RNA methyltransferase n=1 Tax=unclassified Mycolicibacterium TaxID=2636767 RepID=UPI0013058DD1|nr:MULTISPECIES: RNA methyltransferase [unclassified Mycolicibacterium]MUL85912.1 RNA methyltransferase [Mycolicibacterium sp. CBMA 329]MUL91680.1 RNA methyltransferase [Mycolicibacterium sp. CBMA 331]MUM03132.1 RNA methyltransferase [Mycolicibacterium sp. CBMA 334]MUM29518.1 RNA methyltransferase [Mycolicibacterium sp. CBMA 295]MUM41975.1 RNA methyltransferase [Mycolicibacterium sp. CBMA 247]
MAAAVKLQRHVGRRRAARFLTEGPNLVEAALRRGLVSEVFATETALDRFGALLADAPVQLVTERAAKALSDTVTPVGLVAVCRLPEVSLDEVLAATPRLVAVAVQISEPGNAGTLIRAADAMGADAVVLAGNSVDPYNSKCLRASAGSIFSLPVISETDEAATVSRLQAAGLQVLATTVDGEASLDHVDLAPPTAWLFGPEAHGLPTELAAAADHRVHIPMPGHSESLNIASAASICLYQSARAHRSASD